MKNILLCILLACFGMPTQVFSQVSITIDASVQPTPVSRYLYGRNNSLSDDPSKPLTAGDWARLRDAGVTIFRESGGNNCSKYNWRNKMSSHPDWYNNVYPHDWDFAAKSLQQNLPSMQGMWAFQLLGKAAKTNAANFADYSFNGSAWWMGVNQNLAGGGQPNPATWSQVTDPNAASTKAAVEGNTDLYLENWTADSTVLLLDHWFNTMGLDKNKLQYWNMDNEVEIWSGTHDDVMPSQISADDFIQRYVAVATKARAAFPGIKIVGPVTANEWQWYNWNGNIITVNGTNYPWLEYFIKRIAEEQQSSGVRLLDVLDIHFYPNSKNNNEVVQMHRVFFDRDYVYPEANGVKKINGGYDNSQTKEYILARCNDWLVKYMGASHNVKLGVTEIGVQITDPNAVAVWYAGTIGEFMKRPEMEIFTPWTWKVGMWEVLHLFSRYDKAFSIGATSSNETSVSAYPTLNAGGDSLTVMLVNRSTSSQTVTLNFKNYVLANESFTTLKLSNLPSTETFVSHSANALQKGTVNASSNGVRITIPSMTVTGILLKGAKGDFVTAVEAEVGRDVMQVFPVPPDGGKIHVIVNVTGESFLDLVDQNNRVVKEIYHGSISKLPFSLDIDTTQLSGGVYFLRLQSNGNFTTKKVLLK